MWEPSFDFYTVWYLVLYLSADFESEMQSLIRINKDAYDYCKQSLKLGWKIENRRFGGTISRDQVQILLH